MEGRMSGVVTEPGGGLVRGPLFGGGGTCPTFNCGNGTDMSFHRTYFQFTSGGRKWELENPTNLSRQRQFCCATAATTVVCLSVCLSVGHASTTEHALKIRQHYVYLLDSLDTKYSGLLDELFCANVRIYSHREENSVCILLWCGVD